MPRLQDLSFEVPMKDRFRRMIPLHTAGDKDVVQPHSHNYDHHTSCRRGKMRVQLDDITTDLTPDDEPLLVPADAMHSAWALVDNSIMMCEFRHRDPTDEIITKMGMRAAYD